jgi:predicted Zn-dependent protease
VYHSAGSPLFHRGGYAHSPKPGASDTYPNPREAREAGLERCPICFPEDGGGIVGRLIQEQVGGAGDFVEQLKSKHPTVQEVPTELRTLLVRLFRQRLRQRINPRMVLIEADKFHGFGLENGTIMLSEGLLRLMESELETAAQVAHQMAHMDLRHDASAVQTSRLQSLIEQAINRTTSVDFTFQDLKEYSPNIPGFQYYSELIQQGYGEPQERQAAFFAMVYLYRAGFDMKGVAQIMRKRADMESGVHPRWLEYVLKHPYPSDVQTRIRQWSRRIPKAFERNLSP